MMNPKKADKDLMMKFHAGLFDIKKYIVNPVLRTTCNHINKNLTVNPKGPAT
jgi:hypothetical protein